MNSKFARDIMNSNRNVKVLAITLLASYLIRLSPFLGHYLFGVKYDR